MTKHEGIHHCMVQTFQQFHSLKPPVVVGVSQTLLTNIVKIESKPHKLKIIIKSVR